MKILNWVQRKLGQKGKHSIGGAGVQAVVVERTYGAENTSQNRSTMFTPAYHGLPFPEKTHEIPCSLQSDSLGECLLAIGTFGVLEPVIEDEAEEYAEQQHTQEKTNKFDCEEESAHDIGSNLGAVDTNLCTEKENMLHDKLANLFGLERNYQSTRQEKPAKSHREVCSTRKQKQPREQKESNSSSFIGKPSPTRNIIKFPKVLRLSDHKKIYPDRPNAVDNDEEQKQQLKIIQGRKKTGLFSRFYHCINSKPLKATFDVPEFPVHTDSKVSLESPQRRTEAAAATTSPASNPTVEEAENWITTDSDYIVLEL